MDWWLTQVGGVPVGPASTELVLRGIEQGKVPIDVLVCEVGGSTWKSLREVPEFAAVLRPSGKVRFDPNNERTVLDPQFFPPSRPPPPGRHDSVPVGRYDDSSDRTVAEPTHSSLEPQRRRELRDETDEEDKTMVDSFPPLPSEPPK